MFSRVSRKPIVHSKQNPYSDTVGWKQGCHAANRLQFTRHKLMRVPIHLGGSADEQVDVGCTGEGQTE
jgi:hypothetical protein